MIIARISRYATKERVLGNSWLLKLFMVPMEILFLTYFWKKAHFWWKRAFFDLSKWWITEYGHVAESKYQNIYCEYHAIIYQLPQTSPNFFQNTLNPNSKSFRERKMANFTKKWSVCENCEYKMPFSELFLEKKTILIWTYFPSGQFWPCIFIR